VVFAQLHATALVWSNVVAFPALSKVRDSPGPLAGASSYHAVLPPVLVPQAAPASSICVADNHSAQCPAVGVPEIPGAPTVIYEIVTGAMPSKVAGGVAPPLLFIVKESVVVPVPEPDIAWQFSTLPVVVIPVGADPAAHCVVAVRALAVPAVVAVDAVAALPVMLIPYVPAEMAFAVMVPPEVEGASVPLTVPVPVRDKVGMVTVPVNVGLARGAAPRVLYEIVSAALPLKVAGDAAPVPLLFIVRGLVVPLVPLVPATPAIPAGLTVWSVGMIVPSEAFPV
jgi:hypothetical protein